MNQSPLSNATVHTLSNASEGAPVQARTSEWVSICVDGEWPTQAAGEVGGAALVAAWREDASVRKDWNDFHRIGDILRSEDLSGDADDARFLANFRARLANEPVILAPQPALKALATRPPATWRRWAAPASVAAGVIAVSSVVWMLQSTPRGESAVLMSSASAPFLGTQPMVGSLLPGAPGANALSIGSLRSGHAQVVEFEPYFVEHKQFQPANGQGPAAGFLQAAVFESH